MKTSVNFKHVDSHQSIEKEMERHSSKLGKLLKTYDSDLPQLHATFSRNGRADEFSCALTLSLPTGTLHATATGPRALSSCKKAFSEIEAQVKKHQARLRKDYEWKRKRPLRRAEVTLT
jgi:ribosome-associated translation inhibitor RaiA